MNRRNFLKTNAALTAGILLPKAIFSQTETCKQSNYYGKISDDKVGELWTTSMKICEKATINFDSASADDKLIKLTVNYYKNGLGKGQAEKGWYKFEITSVKTNSTTKTATCKARLDSYDKNGYQFSKKMFTKRKISFTIKTIDSKRIITISSKKGELGSLSRTISSSSSGSSGCYLTTAVVNNQQLSDNCMELETLRFLRDQYMLNNAEGKKLIKRYYNQAPDLVKRIDSFENSAEIYDYMYKHMIIPSVKLVQNGQPAKAASLYKNFSELLYKEYSA